MQLVFEEAEFKMTKEDKTKLQIQWEVFHEKNPHVYELIKKFTYEVIKAGRRSYSINAIFERVRWHTNIETSGAEFKISNNHRAYYARLFLKEHPEYPNFFKTKELRSEA